MFGLCCPERRSFANCSGCAVQKGSETSVAASGRYGMPLHPSCCLLGPHACSTSSPQVIADCPAQTFSPQVIAHCPARYLQDDVPEAVKLTRLQEIIATYRAELAQSMAAEVGRTHLVRCLLTLLPLSCLCIICTICKHQSSVVQLCCPATSP